MDITLSLSPEMETGLLSRAQARGVSLHDLLLEIVAKEAGGIKTENHPAHSRHKNLSDLLLHSPFAGADLRIERSKDYPRPLDLN